MKSTQCIQGWVTKNKDLHCLFTLMSCLEKCDSFCVEFYDDGETSTRDSCEISRSSASPDGTLNVHYNRTMSL